MTDPLAYVAAFFILVCVAWTLGCCLLMMGFALKWALAKLKG